MRGGDQWPSKLYNRHSMVSKKLCYYWYTWILKKKARLHRGFLNRGFFFVSIWCVFLVSNPIGFPIQIDRFFFILSVFWGLFTNSQTFFGSFKVSILLQRYVEDSNRKFSSFKKLYNYLKPPVTRTESHILSQKFKIVVLT